MSTHKKYNVQDIKERVELILSGENVTAHGNHLTYGTKKMADRLVEKLREEGINCYTRKSLFNRTGYDIVFSDIK